MVSVTSASRYITSASRYHPRYQSRSSMYIHGLIPRNFAELAEADPIVLLSGGCLAVPWVGQWYVLVTFPGHTNSFAVWSTLTEFSNEMYFFHD